MKNCDAAYQAVFDAWDAGKPATALERCRDLLRNFPDYTIDQQDIALLKADS